jgi:hypothetical protein
VFPGEFASVGGGAGNVFSGADYCAANVVQAGKLPDQKDFLFETTPI